MPLFSRSDHRSADRGGGLASALVIGLAFLSLAATVVLAVIPLTRPDSRAVVPAPPPPGEMQSTGVVSGAKGQARTRAGARAAAEEALGAYASGDYARFYRTWSSAGRKLISLREYVRLYEMCPQPSPGVPFEIEKVTVSGDRAVVRATRGRSAYAFEFVYQRKAWRYVLTAEQRRDYARDVAELAAERRGAGRCGQG